MTTYKVEYLCLLPDNKTYASFSKDGFKDRESAKKFAIDEEKRFRENPQCCGGKKITYFDIVEMSQRIVSSYHFFTSSDSDKKEKEI